MQSEAYRKKIDSQQQNPCKYSSVLAALLQPMDCLSFPNTYIQTFIYNAQMHYWALPQIKGESGTRGPWEANSTGLHRIHMVQLLWAAFHAFQLQKAENSVLKQKIN